jgi:hypothetical protein
MNTKTSPIIPITAGLLLCTSSFLGFIIWAGFFFIDQYLTYALTGCILSLFPLIAGILALKRIRWKICFLCSLIGLFTIITPLLYSAILASLGFLLILISKKEFQS